jgi:hypothetical protein
MVKLLQPALVLALFKFWAMEFVDARKRNKFAMFHGVVKNAFRVSGPPGAFADLMPVATAMVFSTAFRRELVKPLSLLVAAITLAALAFSINHAKLVVLSTAM